MADLVEIAFPSEEKAEQVRQKLLDMQKEYLIELSDAVIAVKQPNGHVKLNQLFNPTATGAALRNILGCLDRHDLPDAAGRCSDRCGLRAPSAGRLPMSASMTGL